jgi:uracil-DNA glycosylase
MKSLNPAPQQYYTPTSKPFRRTVTAIVTRTRHYTEHIMIIPIFHPNALEISVPSLANIIT